MTTTTLTIDDLIADMESVNPLKLSTKRGWVDQKGRCCVLGDVGVKRSILKIEEQPRSDKPYIMRVCGIGDPLLAQDLDAAFENAYNIPDCTAIYFAYDDAVAVGKPRRVAVQKAIEVAKGIKEQLQAAAGVGL